MTKTIGSWLLAAALVAGAAPGASARPADAEAEGFRLLSTLDLPYAEDVETTTIAGRPIAVAVAAPPDGRGGSLVVVDMANTARPKEINTIECPAGGFVDVVPTASPSLFAVFAYADGGRCLGVRGFGFALVDVAKPARPRVLSATAQEPGSPSELPRSVGRFAGASFVAHPSKPFLYSTRILGEQGEILVWSIADPRKPSLVTSIPTALAPRSLAVGPGGDALAVAVGAAFALFDLSDPASPAQSSVQQCPGCTQTTLVRFAGQALLVYDESLNPVGCPSGALWFYMLDTAVPRLTGVYNPSRIEEDPTAAPLPRLCAATDLAVSADGGRVLLNWENNSVRMIAIPDATGVAASEAGWFRVVSGDVAAARWLGDDEVVAVDRNLGLHVLTAEAG